MPTVPPPAIGPVTAAVGGVVGEVLAFTAFYGEGTLTIQNTGLQSVTIEVAYSYDGTNVEGRDYGIEQSINGDSGLGAGEVRGGQIPMLRGGYLRVRAYTGGGSTDVVLNVYRPPRYKNYPSIGD